MNNGIDWAGIAALLVALGGFGKLWIELRKQRNETKKLQSEAVGREANRKLQHEQLVTDMSAVVLKNMKDAIGRKDAEIKKKDALLLVRDGRIKALETAVSDLEDKCVVASADNTRLEAAVFELTAKVDRYRRHLRKFMGTNALDSLD